MRLESSKPENESQFYTRLNRKVGGEFYFERVEPSNECGFPDIYFVRRNVERPCEGTIELKYTETQLPDLRTLCRGTQKAALIDYFDAGGRRRFALCYCNGEVFFWNTAAFLRAIVSDSLMSYTSRVGFESVDFRDWLTRMLEG